MTAERKKSNAQNSQMSWSLRAETAQLAFSGLMSPEMTLEHLLDRFEERRP